MTGGAVMTESDRYCLQVQVSQTRAGTVRELNWLNWTNWTESLKRRAPNWTEQTVRHHDDADELNWTNFLFTHFELNFASPRRHTAPPKSKPAQPETPVPDTSTQAGGPIFPREGASNRISAPLKQLKARPEGSAHRPLVWSHTVR